MAEPWSLRPAKASDYDFLVALHEATMREYVEQVWGWDDDYAQLQAVGREAVRAHPGAYASGVLDSLRDLAFARYTGPAGGDIALAENYSCAEWQ